VAITFRSRWSVPDLFRYKKKFNFSHLRFFHFLLNRQHLPAHVEKAPLLPSFVWIKSWIFYTSKWFSLV
jgi:hypothetical protein